MYSADDVILRADAFGRPEESAFSLLEDGNPNKKQILRYAQNDALLSLYRNDENTLVAFVEWMEQNGISLTGQSEMHTLKYRVLHHNRCAHEN